MSSEKARRRYWARNFLGWSRWSSVLPNNTHHTLASWERLGKLPFGLVTQNVDQLHFKSGSSRVVELHGSNSIVHCMSCSHHLHRQTFQSLLASRNPEMSHKSLSEELMRPDGDVDLTTEDAERFEVPPCPRCGDGILKPKVVFFWRQCPQGPCEQSQVIPSVISATPHSWVLTPCILRLQNRSLGQRGRNGCGTR
eukprot:TRINITY_DN4360_c0_g1_i3.p1 TRINITY_DN4360_c0_g1~~TRINITY_DN4360_c0_g1_i3.p1  ORF type:complete len:196 (-),score=26.18 TRINITY_DN4360_c0_g1_i3:114-701(-)